MTMLSAADVLAKKSNRKPAQRALTATEAFGSDMLSGLNSAERKRLEKTAKALKKVRSYYVKKSAQVYISRALVDAGDTVYISDSYSVVAMPYISYRTAFPELPNIEPGYSAVRYAHSKEWRTSQGASLSKITEDALKNYGDGLSIRLTLREVPDYPGKLKTAIICKDENSQAFIFNGAVLVLADRLQLDQKCINYNKTKYTVKNIITDPSYPVRMLALGIIAPVPEK